MGGWGGIGRLHPHTHHHRTRFFCTNRGVLTTATTMHTSEGSNSNNKTAANEDDAAVIPIHLIWGTEDVVTPVEGGVGAFYTNMANNNINNNKKNDARHQHQYHPKVTMTMIRSGHIPFDDNPIAAGTALVEWLETIL